MEWLILWCISSGMSVRFMARREMPHAIEMEFTKPYGKDRLWITRMIDRHDLDQLVHPQSLWHAIAKTVQDEFARLESMHQPEKANDQQCSN